MIKKINSMRYIIILPYAWLILFLLIPFAFIFKISFAEEIIASPPYRDLWVFVDGYKIQLLATLDSYRLFFEEDIYVKAILGSIKIAFFSAFLALILAYPIALAIARSKEQYRNFLLFLIIMPFWTSFLIRVYAWKVLLQGQGLINQMLLFLGVIDQPVQLLYTDFAVYIGIVYSYFPFMVLPIYGVLEKMDKSLLEAASDLGARPLSVFWYIMLPLSMPGIIAGFMLVFIPAVGEFVIPELLGGPSNLMIGRMLWQEFFNIRSWPMASAIAVLIMICVIIPIIFAQWYYARNRQW